jgi:hypothetical protein
MVEEWLRQTVLEKTPQDLRLASSHRRRASGGYRLIACPLSVPFAWDLEAEGSSQLCRIWCLVRGSTWLLRDSSVAGRREGQRR